MFDGRPVLRAAFPPADLRPEDEALETAAMARIVAAALGGDLAAVDAEPATPWIAFRLGSHAEWLSREGRHDQAIIIAYASLGVAHRCDDPARIYANLLTVANTHAMAGETDDALRRYLEVLRLPYAGGSTERAMADVGAANIYAARGDVRRALFHCERAAELVLPLFDDSQRATFATMLAQRYHAAGDAIGCLHYSELAGMPAPPELVQQLLSGEGHVDAVLQMHTRLRFFGRDELAAGLAARWKSRQEGSA